MVDIWGRMFLDAWRGEVHPHSFHRDDGNVNITESAAHYLEAPRSRAEREVLQSLHGRVLDLACGAGRYALSLQALGCDVVAVDSSPGAIDVCHERGCQDARVVPIDRPAHLAYHARNRAAGRPPGLARMRIGYRGELGGWQELWMPTPAELTNAAGVAAWDVTSCTADGNNYVYEARVLR
jgi:hypothetical protein